MSLKARAKGLSPALVGAALMVLATLATAGQHATLRFLSTGIHPFEIAFFRCLFGLLVLAPLFLRRGLAPLRTRRLGLHVLRSLLNVTSMLAFFFALSLTPLAQATVLNFTTPVFATLLAVLVLGEVIRWRRIAAMVVAFTGVMLVIRPEEGQASLGPLLVLFSAAVWGGGLVVTKLIVRTDSSVTIVTHVGLMLTPITFGFALFVWTWPTATELAWLLLIGVLASISQWSVSEAFRHAETGALMPVDFLRLIWASMLGYLIFAEVPEASIWVGALLIMASVAYITYREARTQSERRAARAGAPGPVSTRAGDTGRSPDS